MLQSKTICECYSYENFILAKCVEQTDHGCTQCDATTTDDKEVELSTECNQDCILDNRLDECQGINLIDAVKESIKE